MNPSPADPANPPRLPKPDPAAAPAPSVVRFPGPWQHRDISANGIRFHLAEAGQGPLVLLLHDFGQFWWSWRHQLEQLPRLGLRAVAVDLRGYGDTDKPPRGYDAFTLAGDTAGLIRSLGEREGIVVGAGIGGLTAFNTASIRSPQVSAVVALAAAHPLSLARIRKPKPAGGYASLLSKASWPWWLERRLSSAGGAALERALRRDAGPAWAGSADFAEAVVALRRAITIPGVAQAAVDHLRWITRSPWRSDGARHRDALSRRPVDCPVLQIGGQLDPVIPESMLSQAQTWCRGRYSRHLLPGVGHYPAEEAPEKVNALIAELAASLR